MSNPTAHSGENTKFIILIACVATIGGFLFGLSQLLFVWGVVRCMRGIGDKATDQVWEGAQGLEWEVPSPAPYHTFDTPPVVK